ncbi:uncharacterized protein LOC135694862 [Rhopilema esculentum]|uniref:uncharacterized protein LOC135694862 n=1 Tax=Rhopilema esculentum TaxID=499914 RepID=UPI0031E087FD|eukprot:gene4252-20445_t
MGNPRNRTRKRTRKGKNTREVSAAKIQRLVSESTGEVSSGSDRDEIRPQQSDQQTPVSRNETGSQSSSGKKLGPMIEAQSEEKSHSLEGFLMFDMLKLIEMLSVVCCPSCKEPGLQLCEALHKKFGFSKCLVLDCPKCSWSHEFNTSSYARIDGKSRNNMEVNVRTIMAFREIGVGYEGLVDFATIMNMAKPMTRKSYNNIVSQVHGAFVDVASKSMQQAAEEVKMKEGTADIAASFDGSWQKPGHSSLNGIVSAISISSGKVLDYEVKSKKCKGCDAQVNLDKASEEYMNWKIQHGSFCTKNHSGSSGQMEVAGVLDMFKRSEERYGLRYIAFIGDGDSSTFSCVSNAKPYGEHISIEKKECVGHVQKRLGSRLRKLKVSYGKKKLGDGKTIGGRGRLTEKLIDKMQNYYGLAIRKNKGNLDRMANDTLAGLYHISSNANNPRHDLCPKGKESWCGWQRDLANGTKNFTPTNGLASCVFDALLPVYKSLSDKTLLSRCLDSFTQNPNESLNNMIWRRCPKKIYQGKKIVELCTASAVANFNDGASSLNLVLSALGINPGCHTIAGTRTADINRVKLAEKMATDKAKKQRKKLRAIKKGLWDKTKQKEGVVYESGAF